MLYHNARCDLRYNDGVDGPARALLTVPLVEEQAEHDCSDSDGDEEGGGARRHAGLPVGVIQLRRRQGPAFTPEELQGHYLVARTALMVAVHAGALQVRFRRYRFSPTGELGYRGAVGLGYRSTVLINKIFIVKLRVFEAESC